ncbi:MAG: SEC-C domain-containing protein, partial [Laribacter sp.]|nr:SEC-C domain-containing protein [Laribacter sp.]
FASERVSAIMQRLNMPEGEAIEHSWVTRAIENAQRKVEGRNFDIRKQLLEYDDVANDQRRVIYQQRNEILESEEVSDMIAAMRDDVLSQLFDTWMPPQSIEEQWDAAGLMRVLEADYQISVPLADWIKAEPNAELDTFKIRILEQARALYDEKVAAVGAASMQQFERAVLLQHFDGAWREHLAALDHLRQGIHLRGYAQKNPKQEYKREAFELFSLMLDRIKREVTQIVATVQIRNPEEAAAAEAFEHEERPMTYRHDEFTVEGDEAGEGNPFTAEKLAAAGVRVGRNDPCPCGSGKRYKQCHGRLA